jgi:hypothetical protein
MNVKFGNESAQFHFGNMQPLVEKILEKENNTCISVIQLISKWKIQETLLR